MRSRLAASLIVTSLLLAGGAGAQTYDPASGASPLTLLKGPADGVAWYRTLLRARELNLAENWVEAEPLWEQLVREYPRDAEAWMLLGRTRYRLNKGLEAVAAWDTAGQLVGWDIEYPNGYRVALGYLRAGDRRAALDALRTMIFERRGMFRQNLLEIFPQLEPLKDDPEFREITGYPDTTGWTRDQGWLHDIDFLYAETRRVNPQYHDRPFPAELTRRYEALKASVPSLSDEEIYFGMKRMLAPLHQGHVFIFGYPRGLHLPLRLYAFPDGVYVTGAGDAHADLVGSRVLTIGSLAAEEALRRMAEARSVDGDMEHVWGTAYLSEIANLRGMGAIESGNAVELTVQRPGGPVRAVTVAGAPPLERRPLVPPPGVPAPLFLRNNLEKHWEQPLPEHDALYVQVNNLLDDTDETLEQFGDRLWTVLQTTRPRNLILDLRHNNGGVTQMYPSLLRTLVAFTREPDRQMYVLIGRSSYSATGNFVTDLERLTRPLFVGESTSECCNLHGDPVVVTLPYSGIQAELTAVMWQLSTPSDRRRELSPKVPVQLTADAYFAGRDPALEAIFRLIADARAAEGRQP